MSWSNDRDTKIITALIPSFKILGVFVVGVRAQDLSSTLHMCLPTEPHSSPELVHPSVL